MASRKLPQWVARACLATVPLGICQGTQADLGVCGFYQKAYEGEIVPKILGGVPFELMGALFENGKLMTKKVVHIKYNLWDEVITVRAADQVVAKVSVKAGAAEICKHLEFGETLRPSHKYTYRLLLNPMWSARMARLQVSTGTEKSGIVGINWQKLAEEMPSDKVLVEKEITP